LAVIASDWRAVIFFLHAVGFPGQEHFARGEIDKEEFEK
jgi:hypothetical protein